MKRLTLLAVLAALISLTEAQTRVGLTYYDLQTNSSSCRRVAMNAAGEVAITYTRSMAPGITPPDRGTGYNYWDGSSWRTTTFGGSFTRPDLDRTGWPNVLFTRNGREVVVSHFASASIGDGLQVMHRDLGTTGSWTQQHLDDNPDATWARAANKGDSIIVINGNFGDPAPIFNGVEGGIQMWRSFDAGDTWTGPDSIPGVNGTNFANIGGDAYALDVNENGTVALVAGDFHTQLWKSTDFGDTWSQTIVNASPNPLFSGEAGETLSATDTLDASDGAFAVLLDPSDVAHVWYGKQVVFDDDPAEGWSFFPFDNGIMYWNETFSGDPVQVPFSEFLLGEVSNEDCGAFTTNAYNSAGTAPQPYSGAYVTHPSAGIGDDGTIYLTFSRTRTAILDSTGTVAQNADFNGYLRQDIFLTKSTDGGATWVDPINVSNSLDKESTFPSIQRNIFDDQIHVVWQEDPEVGTSIQDAFDGDGVFDTCQILHRLVTSDMITSPYLSLVFPVLDTVDVLQGSGPYTDPGFEFDSCRYAQVVDTLDNVNTGVVGFYDYTYRALSINGDTTDLNRVVNVIPADVEEPVITSLFPATIEACEPFNPVAGVDYEAFDNIDLDVTSDVTVDDSALDINAPGVYTITLEVTDDAGNTATLDVDIEVVDNTAPDITLDSLSGQGANPTYVYLGTSYTDPGATATDCVDGSVSITSSGTVDAATEGTYTITYEAEDSEGNISTEDRTVIVGREPEADFQAIQTAPLLIVADDQSLYDPTDWIWDWGDGSGVDSIQTGANQTHLYATAGDFDICLRVRNAFNDAPFNEPVSEYCETKTITSVRDIELLRATNLYPNPTTGQFTVELSEVDADAVTVEVVDALGTVIRSMNDDVFTGSERYDFDVSELAAGIYFVNVRTNTAGISLKVVVD